MNSRRRAASAGALAGGLALLLGVGAASAQLCTHPSRFTAVCRYVVTRPEPLEAEAVGRLARVGPHPHADLVLRVDGQLCGTGGGPGLFGHGEARARCVLKPDASRRRGPTHVAVAELSGLSDAEPVSLDVRVRHHGGLLSLPLEEPKLAPDHAHRKWLGLFGR